jgi:hypothetical protein
MPPGRSAKIAWLDELDWVSMSKFHVEIVDAVEGRREREGGDKARWIACEVPAASEPQAIQRAWTRWEDTHGRGDRPAYRRITIEGIEEES